MRNKDTRPDRTPHSSSGGRSLPAIADVANMILPSRHCYQRPIITPIMFSSVFLFNCKPVSVRERLGKQIGLLYN